MLTVAVAAAGALGAVLRVVCDDRLRRLARTDLPVGILAVNVVGSFVLAVVVGSARHHGLDPDLAVVAGTGLCGGFTTFSTHAADVVRLVEHRLAPMAVLNLGGTLVAGLGAAAAGLALTS